ncbi:MAG: hypothetical protein UMV23_05430 [Halanaerobium sp.]|nr:hypothetical protein [Halanaerobium sp.]
MGNCPRRSVNRILMVLVMLGAVCLFPLQAGASSLSGWAQMMLMDANSEPWHLDLGSYVGYMNDSNGQLTAESTPGLNLSYQFNELNSYLDTLQLDWAETDNLTKEILFAETDMYQLQDLSKLSLFDSREALSFEEKYLSDIRQYEMQGEAEVAKGVNLEMAHRKKLQQSGLQVISVEEVNSAGLKFKVLPIATLGAEFARSDQEGNNNDLEQTNYNIDLQLSSRAKVKALFTYLLSDLENGQGNKTDWDGSSVEGRNVTQLGVEYQTSDDISVTADIISDEFPLNNNDYQTMVGVRYTSNGNLIALHYKQGDQPDSRVVGAGIEFGLLDQALISAAYSTEVADTIAQRATISLDFDFSLGEDVLLNMGYKRVKEESEQNYVEDLENMLEATLEIRF